MSLAVAPVEKLVSIVMPTYNARTWVRDTIDNVLTQTYPHIELIVVDDGSTDDTVAVVRRKLAADFRGDWRMIEMAENRGPSAARNAGLAAARGGWVQFLDSDDFLAPEKFSRQMAICAAEPPDVVCVYSPWRRCYIDDGQVTWTTPLVQPDMSGRAPIMCLVSNQRPLHGAGLARRSTLAALGGFDESLRFWECEELMVRLAKAGRMRNVASDVPFYLWREHRDRDYIGDADARYDIACVALGWIEQMVRAAEGRTFEQLGLSDQDRQDILLQCTEYGRWLYARDRRAFRKYVQIARTFDPDLAPAHPRFAARLSRWLGYETAEGAARLSRAPAALLRRLTGPAVPRLAVPRRWVAPRRGAGSAQASHRG